MLEAVCGNRATDDVSRTEEGGSDGGGRGRQRGMLSEHKWRVDLNPDHQEPTPSLGPTATTIPLLDDGAIHPSPGLGCRITGGQGSQ